MAKGFLYLFILVFLALGCSPKTQAPYLENAPPGSLNTAACKNTNLNFTNLNAQNIRGIINCLNGDQNKLLAYKEFLDSASTEDLNAVLDAFNFYMPWGSQRHKDFLDVIKLLNQKGYLQGFLTQVQVLGENKLIQKFVKAALPVWEENSVFNPEPELEVIYKYLAKILENNEFNELIESFEILANPSAFTAAAYLALPYPQQLGSDKATDLISNLLLEMFHDQSFNSLVRELSKVDIIKTFKTSNQAERQGFESVFSYAASRAEDNYNYLKRAQLMIASIQTPVTCFFEKPGQRRAESLLKFLIDEVKGKTKQELDEFWLKTIALLFSSSQGLCNISPYTIANYDVVTDMVKAGHGKDYAEFWTLLSKNPEFDSLVESLKSPNYVKAAPVISEVAKREVLKHVINMLSDDLTDKGANAQSRIFSHLSEPNLQKSFIKVFQRVLNNNNRLALKEFSKSLVSVWADSRGGLGEFTKVVSQSTKVLGNKPIEEFFTLLFKDQNLINKTSPAFIRLVKNKHFESAVELTSALSGSGELAKLIVFIADLLRNGQLPPQNISTGAPDYTKTPAHIIESKSPVTTPPDFESYKPCLDIKGGLFGDNGSNLERAAHCFNHQGKYPEFVEVINVLKANQLLSSASKILSFVITESHLTGNLLNELELLLNKGLVTKLTKIYFELMHSGFSEHIDLAFNLLLKHPDLNSFLNLSAVFLERAGTSQTFSSLLDITLKKPKKFYFSQNQYRLKVKDPSGIKNQIVQWYPDLNTSQIEQIYQEARENFETHNDTWLYQEGSYEKQSYEQFRSEFFGLISDLLRSNSLEEFILAFQDYAKDKSALEFVQFLSDWQMVSLNYKSDGQAYVRIQSGLDALENLVLNSDFGYVIMDHIGLSFQIAVVNSNDFVKTIKEQRKLVKLGHDVSKNFGPKEKYYKFKNMLSSFPVLELIAQNKQLRVLQRLYRAFYNATPIEYREVQDPKLNYMNSIDRFNKMGFFKNLTIAIRQADSQNQAGNIVNVITNLALKVKKEDIPFLRKSLNIIVEQARLGGNGPVEQLLKHFWNLQNDLDNYEKFKTHLMHFALGQENILPHLSPIIKILPEFLVNPNANRLINTIVNDLKSSEQSSALFSLGSNMSLVTNPDKLKNELNWLFDQNQSEKIFKIILDIYNSNPELIEALVSDFRLFINSNEDLLSIHNTLVEASLILKSIYPMTGQALMEPQMREAFVRLNLALSENGGIKKTNQSFSKILASSNLEQELHFLFAHFKKYPLNSK
ncbi:MAG: hypothetical protein IPM57_09165 [Oligoflexia bacterium]|nr:hypothetical protein [Oligoflexia bacterium]